MLSSTNSNSIRCSVTTGLVWWTVISGFLWRSSRVTAHGDHSAGSIGEVFEHESCACVAAQYNFALDCDKPDAMLESIVALQANNCRDDCTSDVCARHYYIVQSHHDYCPEDMIPAAIEDGFHTYEGSCKDCTILRQPQASLPDCPNVDDKCNDGSGNEAYQALISNGCLDINNCNDLEVCRENFRLLRAVHDTCPDESLDQVAELGIHDLEVPCLLQGCNVLPLERASEQLVCQETHTSSTSTRAFQQVAVLSTTMMMVSMAVGFLL